VSPAARKLVQGAGGNQFLDCSGREAQPRPYCNSFAPARAFRGRQICALRGDRSGGQSSTWRLSARKPRSHRHPVYLRPPSSKAFWNSQDPEM